MEITHCLSHCLRCRQPSNRHDPLICAKWRQLYSQLLKGWLPELEKKLQSIKKSL